MGKLDPLRHHRAHGDLHSAFGGDRFGILAERFARFFGTPKFIIGQTIVVMLWIAVNAWLVKDTLSGKPFDPYPFILLNLMFSTQAAYAAPLILLAQTRQADRDKASEDASARHRQEESDRQVALLTENTDITRQIHTMQEQQMTILSSVTNIHADLEQLTARLAEKGVINGGPGGDTAVNSSADSG